MKQSIEYEIHADLESSSPDFINGLKGTGFFEDPFIHPQHGRTEYVPLCHLTAKPSTGIKQREMFEAAVALARKHPEIIGYIESEVSHIYSGFPENSFQPGVVLGFRAETNFLPAGQFREDEIHVQFDHERTDPKVAKHFREAGWRPAFCPEDYGTGEIWTIQGLSRQIDELLPLVIVYLMNSGGTSSCKVRREVIAHWWMSSPDICLPPVITKINRF